MLFSGALGREVFSRAGAARSQLRLENVRNGDGGTTQHVNFAAFAMTNEHFPSSFFAAARFALSTKMMSQLDSGIGASVDVQRSGDEIICSTSFFVYL